MDALLKEKASIEAKLAERKKEKKGLKEKGLLILLLGSHHTEFRVCSDE